ncbi:PF09907 family protein [Leptospira licerasiae serovar Varillal str. VAR 010]|uniref:PF09907 family protein n=1 Tax=Leptospira licerasiae str. MMD4847 TaxID=1049971 RepID=A0ABN0H6G0_9LEPT|nr:PF09907 family protein [Leptospira licerasiae serovar Varillal str. VAR 010]EJZ41105.1 PF09907 family protein [Leptospira licerasiae str. MMD4847]
MIGERYRSADFLPGNRVVFNIGGNNYRIIVKIEYRFGGVFIRFVGTHSEYDKIDAKTVGISGDILIQKYPTKR